MISLDIPLMQNTNSTSSENTMQKNTTPHLQNTLYFDLSGLENKHAELTKSIQVAIDVADSKAFQSYQVVTDLLKTDKPNEIMLQAIRIENGKAHKKANFSIPNVFAPMIENPSQAEIEGTVFIERTEDHIVIKDKYPVAKTHVLVIPKKDGETILDMQTSKVADLFLQALQTAAITLHLTTAKLLVNVYPPNQEVPHVHLHILSNEAASQE